MMIGVNDSGLLYLARNEHIPPLKKGTPSSNFLQEGLCQVVWRVKIQTHATPFEDGTSPSSGSLWCPSDTPVAMMQWTFLSFCMWCVEIWNGGMGGGSFLDDGWGELLNGSTTSSTILHGWSCNTFCTQTPTQRFERWLTMEDQAVQDWHGPIRLRRDLVAVNWGDINTLTSPGSSGEWRFSNGMDVQHHIETEGACDICIHIMRRMTFVCVCGHCSWTILFHRSFFSSVEIIFVDWPAREHSHNNLLKSAYFIQWAFCIPLTSCHNIHALGPPDHHCVRRP